MQYNIDRLRELFSSFDADCCTIENSFKPTKKFNKEKESHKKYVICFYKKGLEWREPKFCNRLKILDNIRFLLHQDISIQYPIWFGCPHDKEFQIFSLNAEPQYTSNHESFCLVFRYEFNLIDIYIWSLKKTAKLLLDNS